LQKNKISSPKVDREKNAISLLRICAKKISLIPGATGKPTGILQIFLHNLDMFFSSAFFSYFVICPLCPTYLPCFVKTLLQTDKKMTNTVPFIAYISSYPCNDDNNNVFSELRTEKSTIFFTLIVLTTTLNNPVTTYYS